MTLLPFFKREIQICLILVAIVYFQKCFGANPICTTDECKKLGSLYVSNMNKNVPPCVNFYKFACGGWEQRYAKLFAYNNWDFEEEMQEKVYEDLRKLLENTSGPDPPDVQMAKQVYLLCRNAPYFERIDGPALKNVVTKITPWPMLQLKNKYLQFILPLYAIDKQFMRIGGQSAFFDYKIIADEGKYQKVLTQLRRPATPYGVILRTKDWGPEELKHYKAFIELVLKNIMPNYKSLPQDVLAKHINQLLQFRENLRKLIKEARPFVSAKMTIQEFQKWYDSKAKKRAHSEIKWLDVIRIIYNAEGPRSATITPAAEIVVDKKYFSKLADLLAGTPMNVLVNHAHLYFVERHMKFDHEMESELKSSINDGVNPTGKIVYEPRRWRKCIEYLNLKNTLGQMYLRAYFPAAKRQSIQNLLFEGKMILINQIIHSKWVNNQTKAATINKIKNIKNIIGGMDHNSGHSDDVMSSIDVDIFYNLRHNTIFASAGFLQYPMYVETSPFVVKYGTTMAFLGHELYHSVDADGIEFTVDGKSPFWSDPMVSQYNQHSQCFVNQFEGYRNMEFKKRGLTPIPQTPGSTVNEDIADGMGLKLAYIGYKKKLKEQNGVCPILPGFDSVGCEKLFFIAFANTHCTYMTPQRKEKSLLIDEHSLPEIRVNGAVSNLWQFSAAFGCKVDDPLKRPSCDLWQ